ncbi:MAG: aldo/keto reductase [Candidatus Acidiferrum sp.]
MTDDDKLDETSSRGSKLAARPEVSRRAFIQMTAATTLLADLSLHAEKLDNSSRVAYRTLGRTGEHVSCIGLGGGHIGIQATEEESIGIVRAALDSGINFLDNCWDYNQGQSEVRMGKALTEGYRNKAFLMTKIDGHTRAAAAQQIDESLRRLQTDHLDLLQFHEVIRPDDPEKIFGPGGSMEAVLAAKEAGKLHYIGFTGHKSPDIHLKMLDTARKHRFHFDSVQMPLNLMDAHYESFEKKVLPVLVEEGVGVLGMKPLAAGNILKSNTVSAVDCLRYALSLPTSVVITGCSSMENLEQALSVARNYQALSGAEVTALLEKTAEVAKAGEYEGYKNTNRFDGTIKNPQWLG